MKMSPYLHIMLNSVAVCCFLISNVMFSSHAIESPQYTVVLRDADFEVRLYSDTYWMSAGVQGTSFPTTTKEGFRRLYQYMHGANVNSSQIDFTAPVVTSITPPSSCAVKFYLSAEFHGNPPQPNPELSLQMDKWKSHCIAVKKFSGFADDNNIIEVKEALFASLKQHYSIELGIAVLGNNSAYSIAQYNDSRHLTGRLNEVWVNVVSGFAAQGCPP